MSFISSIHPVAPRNMHEPLHRRGTEMTMVNDFSKILHNTNGEFLDWKFKGSLTSKYGHTLFVKQGSIKYEDKAFVLEPDTILRYNLTNNFPKKNLSIKIKVDTQSSKVDINLGGFLLTINPSLITSGTQQGRIDHAIIYEDNTFTLFPQINEFIQFVDNFIQNTENEYQFVIDNTNEEVAVLVNGVVLSLEPFSHLKNLKIDNQQFLSIKAGPNGYIKISELIITQTDVLQESTDNLFSLKLFLINDALVFYDPTNQSKVDVLYRKFNDSSPNNSNLQINYGSVGYVNNTHFLWKNSNRMLKSNSLTNSTVGELVDFSINIWFYISNSNQLRNAQTLIVIGNVTPSNKSISLHINRSPDKFKLSVNHYPTNIILNDYLFEKNIWYNIIYVKTLNDYSFYVDGVFVSTVRMVNYISLPINAPLSIGMDHSRLSYFQLRHARVGLVSVYERALNSVERTALYEDYKIYYQNIPLFNTLFTCDLTKSENVFNIAGFLYMKDTSGNDNSIGKYSGPNVSYDGDSSIKFTTTNQGIFVNSNMLEGNVSPSFNIWILVNKQTGAVPPRDQRILTIGDKFHLTLVITDNDLYGLSFGIESIMGERQERILKPDIWYNITGTRNNDLSGYLLYVDNVIIKYSNDNSVIDFNNSIRVGYHSGTGTNTDHLQLAQIGTLNIFEKGLSSTEIEDLHYLYNVRYLLQNSHINCRITEKFDPLNPNFFGGNNKLSIYTIASSSFRFTTENLTYLYTTNVDDFDFFDGKSFDVSKDVPGYIKVERRLITNMKGLTNVQFPHSFNCWFKLNQEASGLQHVLGYGSTTISNSYVMFIFNQVGDTNKFIPNITTHITNTLSDQDFILPEIETDEWYFFSCNRDTINKIVKVSINGEPFMSQSYIDEMDVDISFSQLSLGGVQISSVYNQQSSVGNFSLFDRPLSIREVKSIFNLDKHLYEPGIIIGGGGGIIPIELTPIQIDRRIRPSLKTGITTDFNFKESLKGDISDVNFDGTNFISNDGFVEVAGGTFMEVVETLPSYVLEPDNNHSWVIQFRSIDTVNNSFKMALTTSPASTSSFSDFTGLRLAGTNENVSAIYYKGVGVILVMAEYTLPINTDLSIGIHQVVTTFNRFSNTLKIYFDNEEPVTATASSTDPIFYSADSTIVLNKLTQFFPPEMVEYHRVASYNRVLSETDVNILYNELNQVIIAPSGIDPNLLVDFQFNQALEADYTKDSSALVFQQSEAGAVSLNPDNVTVNPGKYLELATVLPEYLRNIGKQSWVIHFKILTNNGSIRMALTTSPVETTFSDFTGVRMFISNETVIVNYYKGVGDRLVNASYLITAPINLFVGIHQIVTTYNESTQTLKLYFDDRPVVTSTASTADPIFYSADSTLVLHKLGDSESDDIAEYHRVVSYDKVLTQSEVLTMYDEAQPIVYIPPIDPNLLFDVNFDESSLAVDYTIDGNALTFEPSNASGVTLNDGFVSMANPHYIKLTQGLPAYIKHTGDQSWVFNFRAEATSANRFFIQTTQVDGSFQVSVSERTGFSIALYNNDLSVVFFKGLRDILVTLSSNIGSTPLNINENSVVFTYERLNHRVSLYFNGVSLSSVVAPASFVDDVIDWSTSDNLYVNRFFTYSPIQPAHYYKISAYDKILTAHEIVDIYNASQPSIIIDSPVLNWDFNGSLIDTVESIEFNNQFGIDITSEYVNLNTTGPFPDANNYLNADVPVSSISKFSKSLMFRFKSLEGFHPGVHFSFSTFLGNEANEYGIMVRVVGNNVEIRFHGTNEASGAKNTLHSVNHLITGAPSAIFYEFCHLVVVLDHTNNFITTFINGIQNASTNALVSNTTTIETDAGTYYGPGTTIPFYINRWADWGLGQALYDDFKFFNTALSQQEVSYYYKLTLPPPTPPPPPPQPLIPTIPTLHWDYETFYDNQNAVEFTNPYNIQLIDGKAVIDQAGPNYYLKANIPIELVSPFSKSLMFRFKSSTDFTNVINFVFSTYEGNGNNKYGIMIRVIYDNIQIEFGGQTDPAGLSNILHSAYHPITGSYPIIYDEYCHMVVVLDHTNNFVTSYINGVLNMSANALITGTSQSELDIGTFYGNGATVPFFINKWVTFGEGTALYDDFKFFNSALTPEEVTHYYNESIA